MGRLIRAEMVKPMLRGYSHAAMVPIALLASALLVALGGTPAKRASLALYGATLVVLFTVSAVYHVGHWSPPVSEILRRFDHANIYC